MTLKFVCAAVQTFEEADLAGDGIISLEEWRTLVCHSPDVIGYMTLPVLKDVTVSADLSHLVHTADTTIT